MPEKAFTGVRIPYSDLSGTLDPHKVYETRAKYRATQRFNGLERFAYQVFGPNFIGSLAFALNPYVAYEFPTMRITPVNRTRKVNTIPASIRQVFAWEATTLCQNSPDLTTPQLLDRTGVSCQTTTVPKSGSIYSNQDSYNGFIADTTVRTRPLNSKGGEFELFTPRMTYNGRSSSGVVDNRVYVFPNGPSNEVQVSHYKQRLYSNFVGPTWRVAPSQFDVLLSAERSRYPVLFGKLAMGMLADSVPTTRTFSLARSIGELKDLPMLLRNSLELYRNYQTLHGIHTAKGSKSLKTFDGLGRQYLNFEFGWKPLLKDISDMLALPEQISKEVNRLIDRNGLPTVFRSTRTGEEELSSLPSSQLSLCNNETLIDSSTKGYRKWKLRTACTYTLKFPAIDIPILRQDLLDMKWGANPNPTDVYNLVPWTWLVDWFSGLGQYVDLMNTLATDKSLFNYGYITYISTGDITFSAKLERFNKTTMTTQGPDSYHEVINLAKANHSQKLTYKYQKRIDISSLPKVIALSRPASLRADQYAILGALLSKFASS